MSYLHHPFPFNGHAAIPVDQPMGYGVPIRHPHMGHPIDTYLLPHAPIDLADFYHQAAALEDYEEYAENLSRPRLTKEQVDTLEAQFQAHPKPNSNVKRQLAAQTNLTLPRVANWFQNRRAKAKQQKRQQEFERMQASENNEQWKNNQASQPEGTTPEEEQPERTELSTPTLERTATPPSESPASPHQPEEQSESTDTTQSESATSLQGPIEPSMAAHVQFRHPGEDITPVKCQDSDIDDHPSHSPLVNAHISALTSAFHGWNGNEDVSATWATSQSPEANFDFAHMNGQQLGPTDHSVEIRVREHQGFSNIQYGPESDGWEAQMSNFMGKHQSNNQHPNDAFQPISYGSLQSPMFHDDVRRGSYSSERSELAESLFHADLNSVVGTSPQLHAAHLNQFARMGHPVESDTNWRYPEKEVDLAARRKRPRPAAIGTSGLARSFGPSSMSPTTRISGMGAGHVIRHAKSTQNLSPNHTSRYPGIRKVSAALRSPLGMTTFAEANRFNAASATTTDTMTRVPGLVSTALAPPTPLTPEDFQGLLPLTPNDTQYCISPTDDMGCGRFFPASQPMQLHIESPPTTPLHPGVLSNFQYQTLGMPMSAPSQNTTFQDYSLSIPTGPINSGLWPDNTSLSSPETSHLQPTIHMPQPTHISPITYEESLDQLSAPIVDNLASQSESPQCTIKSSSTPPPSDGSTPGSQKVTEFLIQEFPKQQEAHRHAAQQLPQKPKTYTFTNQTPNDF
ncbi:hypothetical protein FQN55_008580 [Onygenales sp. PD_40]|nr:hypothetical protein FQN55_008580 [Onygenales sp. PD_40]KAK2775336.1 hypothetical protein FQN52_004020 [Onygenales sp. PD_12]